MAPASTTGHGIDSNAGILSVEITEHVSVIDEPGSEKSDESSELHCEASICFLRTKVECRVSGGSGEKS